jgi:hypothetical protein
LRGEQRSARGLTGRSVVVPCGTLVRDTPIGAREEAERGIGRTMLLVALVASACLPRTL